MSAADIARAAIAGYLNGDKDAWNGLVEAAAAWRAEGNVARAEAAEAEARRLRVSIMIRGQFLDLDRVVERLGLAVD